VKEIELELAMGCAMNKLFPQGLKPSFLWLETARLRPRTPEPGVPGALKSRPFKELFMKHALGILCLCLPALGQATYSGAGAFAGSASYGAQGPPGPPLAYGARTDTCETGQEPGCSGLGVNFRLTSSETGPFAQLAPANTAATDPDFHSYLLLATDPNTYNYGSMWSANDAADFSSDASYMLLQSPTGKQLLIKLNEAAILAAAAGGTPCSTSICVSNTGIQSGSGVGTSCTSGCTVFDSQATLRWSSDPTKGNVILEIDPVALQINNLTITCTPSCSFSRAPYVSLVGSGGLPSNYVATGWAPFGENSDGSFTVVMGGAPPWESSHAYLATGNISFIWPPHSVNSGNVAYQAVTSGTSGTTQPTWASAQNYGDTICDDNSAVNVTCSAGVVTWQNIGGIGGQGQQIGPNGDTATYRGPFTVLNYRPAVGLSVLNLRSGWITRASGSSEPSGHAQTDDPIICGKYGYSPCPFTEFATLHMGGPANSQFVAWAPTNSQSGGCMPYGTCSSVLNTNQYRGTYSASTAYAAKDVVYVPDGYGGTYQNPTLPDGTKYYPIYSAGGPTTGCAPVDSCNSGNTVWNTPGNSEGYANNYFWEVATKIVRPVTHTSGLSRTYGHGIQGNIYFLKGGSGNSQYFEHRYSQPQVLCTINGNPEAVPNPTYTVGGVDHTDCVGSGVNGVPLLLANLPSDMHEVWEQDDLQDRPPFCMALTDVPSITDFTGNAQLAWYGEFICAATGRGPDPLGTTYRFAHEYNTGNNASYLGQNNKGTISFDGQLTAISTDMMGTRGSLHYQGAWVSGTSYNQWQVVQDTSDSSSPHHYYVAWNSINNDTVAPHSDTTNWGDRGTNQCNGLRADSKWDRNSATVGAAGHKIMTVSSPYNIYQSRAPGGTTGSSAPDWSTAPDPLVNGTCPSGKVCSLTDNTVTWDNVGPNDCRTDIMLVALETAH
jgi:hypothetical protein